MTLRILHPIALVAAVFAAMVATSGVASAQGLPIPLTDALQQVHVPADALGVYVQQVNAPSQTPQPPLVSWQADLPMQPASTMKLVTSYAALDLLGPTYTWKTPVYRSGTLDGDVLNGDLIIQGGGDPRMVLENFWLLLRQIRAAGIREIRGNLIIDNSWLAPQHFDSAEFDGDPTRPYNVGPDALLVNYKVLELHLHPGDTTLQVENQTPIGLHINADVAIKGGACVEWREGLKPLFTVLNSEISLTLTGNYPRSCGDKVWLVQPYPLSSTDFDGALFRNLWAELGGQFGGSVQAGVLPDAAIPVTVYESAALPEVMRSMNKFSNNVMSRLLLLTIDHEASHLPASQDSAAQLVQVWFERLGIPAQQFKLDNGSGLSRTERISAWQMAAVLQHAFASPYMPELLSSLPLLGADGTMQKRAIGMAVAGHAHLKTGGLTGVRNVAGFVQSASGRMYVVVCFVNHKNAQQTEAAQDRLMQWIYEHG